MKSNALLIILALFIIIFAFLLFNPPIPIQSSNQTTVQNNTTFTKISTNFELIEFNQTYAFGETITIKIKLTDSNSTPIKNANIILNGTIQAQQETGSDGIVVFTPTITEIGSYAFEIIYPGNFSYTSSKTTLNFAVINLETKPLNQSLLLKLQNSLVIVRSPYAVGSGIIIGYENGKTKILTNKQIVDKVSNVSEITVSANDDQVPAVDLLFAPNNISLAFVYIEGIYGSPASLQYDALLGDAVLSLSFDILSEGTVTGVTSTTSTGYEYTLIETDTDLGSGGGIFSDDSLIGLVASNGTDLVVISTTVLLNSTFSPPQVPDPPIGPDTPIPCDLTDPECVACNQGIGQYIVVDDGIYCCGPETYSFVNGVWGCN